MGGWFLSEGCWIVGFPS
ncbi:hypothetical protein Goarm_017259 [Gossypium armourianum]|uniref:Uncharacterized protein n=1 Tax=Gossypium armourianum TaxID=34283 RepID=A0A7J9JFM0_9ROSI|nr:hypothetical protein [Gossypium armourianum]